MASTTRVVEEKRELSKDVDRLAHLESDLWIPQKEM